MIRPLRLVAAALLSFAMVSTGLAEDSFDIVIYGGTSGGVAAAVQAKRMGKTAVVIEPGKHIGGLTSGGLGATDIGNKGAIGGISREFYQAIYKYYSQPDTWKHGSREAFLAKQPGEDTQWKFEPHVAEGIYTAWLKDAGVPVHFGERLDLKSGVEKDGLKITRIKMESGRSYLGKMFIDASYEGDLMAKAGVSYHVGREANSVYNETLNGVQLGSKYHQFKVKVDPYKTPGDPKSGLLPNIHDGGPGEHGSGDHRVQAYNFRMCLTDVPENRVPFPKPAGYDAYNYELSLRTILAGQWDGLGAPQMMPNRKTDTNNNGAFSTDNIGMNYEYPDGDYALRAKIWQQHVEYQQGWCYFLANDPRVPEKIRTIANTWGLAKDEFTDNGHWPHQMYVREARRMISDYVMTEAQCRGRELAPDAVGLAAYTMDSHNTQRYVKDGYASNEGDVQVGGFPPYPIAYQSIVPKAKECANLFVPVCLSASHIAYGSIRMEPVFMVLGQSSATAAVQAIDQGVAVQKVDVKKLQAKLLEDKQILEWTGPRPGAGKTVKQLPGIVQDDATAELVGSWNSSYIVGGFVGEHYLHDENLDQGKKQIRYKLPLPMPGKYEVRVSYVPLKNRATNVPVTIHAAGGEKTVRVNQQKPPKIDELFEPLGVYEFSGKEAMIVIGNEGADGYVIADAVQLLPAK